MKNLLFLYVMFFSFLSCSEIVETTTETKSSKSKLVKVEGTVTEKTKGKVFKSDDGIVYLFNEKEDKGVYNNAFTFLSTESDKISILEKMLNGEVRYEYFLHYASIYNLESHKKVLIAVSNDKGHDFIHSLSEKEKAEYEEIIFVYEMAKINDRNFDINKANINNKSANDFIVSIYNSVESSGCTGGGEGATSCQIEDVFSSCSVSCGAGYYACCKGGSNTCKCIKNVLTPAPK